jgi:hypothetical protein
VAVSATTLSRPALPIISVAVDGVVIVGLTSLGIPVLFLPLCGLLRPVS